MSDTYLLHDWKLEGCWRKGQSTTIHDRATWEYLQDAYRRAVPPGTSTIAIEPTSGVMVPHEIRLIPGKGRGVFATKNIKKGEVIWKNIQSAEFEDELSWRRFVSSIPYELACDVHQWAYVEYDEDDKISILYLDLDDGSFTNTPDGDQDENSTTEEVSIALRDIKAGEEITMSYSGLTIDLDWYKRMKRVAWVEDYDASSSSSSSSTDEEVEAEQNSEDTDSTEEETVTDYDTSNESQEASSTSTDKKTEHVKETSDSTEEEVVRGKTSEDDDSTEEETGPDNEPHKSSGLIDTTTATRRNITYANPTLRRHNGLGASADHDQQHDLYKLLVFVSLLMILWYFWKKSRYRHVLHIMKCKRKRGTE